MGSPDQANSRSCTSNSPPGGRLCRRRPTTRKRPRCTRRRSSTRPSTRRETMLELGSGGGNNASHLKARFKMTLVDLSPGMLEVSRALNPECEHVQGDMRTVRLGREFDAVFVHDAVTYMTSEADVRQAIATAFVHCRPDGVVLFAPDHVRENFRPGTDHGGHDGADRAMRYLEWTWDPDPADTTCIVDYTYRPARARRRGPGRSRSASRGVVLAHRLASMAVRGRLCAAGRADRSFGARARLVRGVRRA